MTFIRTLVLAAVLAGTTALTASAQSGRVVKKEPPMGGMQPGERLLVDDGSCGLGMIKEVIGGNHWRVGGKGNTERQRRCIPR